MEDDQFQQIMARFDAMDARFDHVDRRMDAIYLRLEDHEQRFDDLNRRMAALEDAVSYVAKNTEQGLERIRVLARRIDNLENPESRNLP